MSIQLAVGLGVFQLVLFLIHGAVYQSLVAAFGVQQAWLAWFFAFLAVTFVSATALSHIYENFFVRWYYRASAYWFGFVQFLFAGSVLFYFSERVIYGANYYVSPAALGGIWFGAATLTALYATWQTHRLKLTRVGIELPQLPEFWKNKTIVFVSDLHLGAIWGEAFSKKVVDAIAALVPSVVLIGGDMFDGVKYHPQSLIEPFRALRPPEGIYFASGNHEYIEDTEILLREIERVGIRVLRNEAVDVKGIVFAGVDWKDTHHQDQFEKILSGMRLDPSKPSILMRHEPNHLEIAARLGISFMVSGHTHAGQIYPLRLVTRRMYNGFDYGLKRLRDMLVHTSSGVGTWGPPIRFGTKSEIVVITLK